MRLVPKSTGWIAYVWLVYLLNLPVVLLFMPDTGPSDWLWMAGAILAFLPLYFRSFWASGRELLALVTATVVLAAVAIPFSPGANVFFIYAAAMAVEAGKPRRATLLIGAIMVAIPAHAWIVGRSLGWDVPELLYVYLPALVFTPIIGAVNVFYAERNRQNAELRRAREEVENLAKIAERERIARDLHDLLGHTLSTITLKSELAARLAERDPARAADEMRQVEAISRTALSEVRQAVRGYRSMGLPTEIENARRALDAAGVALDWYAERVEPTAAQENVLSLVLREAITNVIRHAGATVCRVRLWRDDEGIHLEIADDGRGGVHPEGSGLSGMRERVASYGGRVRLRVEDGTTLRVTLPARDPAAADRVSRPKLRPAARPDPA